MHSRERAFRFGWLVALLCLCGVGTLARAQEAYTSGDNNFGFKYPKRWQAEADGAKVHLTSPDGNRFLVQADVLKSMPSGPPAYDAGVKAEAAQFVAKLLPKAELVRAQTAVVDHGAGAVFRFQEQGKGDNAQVAAVWVAIIGKHSVVIVPEKAAQAGEAIGLSTVIQSVTFADSLPKAPPVRVGPRTGMSPGTDAGAMASGTHTVSFQNQIAPILNQRCRACHNGGSSLGGLNVVSFTSMMKGGEHGALVTPGRPANSLLMDYLTGKRDRMPKGSDALSEEQIGLFRTWIQEGATDDAAGGAAGAAVTPGTKTPGAGVRRAANRPNANRPAATRSNVLEVYSGHLIVNDGRFNLALMRDGTAIADWTFSPTVAAHFTGTYRGADGSYSVSLTLASGSTPYQTKTMVLDLRSHGAAEIGRFGLDTEQARRDIASLELSGFDVDFKKGGGGAAKGVNRNKRPQ